MSQKINFTKALLLEARPSSNKERLVLWDAKTPGLQCRISHTGNITFSIYKRMKGYAAERVTLGKFPQMSIEQARINAAKVNAAIAVGENPAEVKRAHKAEMTFKELYNEYEEKHSKHKKRSWNNDKSQFDLYLEKPIGHKKLSQIKRADIANLHLSISRQVRPTKNKDDIPQYKSTTANRVLALISSVFNWGVKNGKCSDNPVKGIEKNKEKSRDRFLQPEELASFFKAVQNETNETIRDYVLLSLYTGARRSNVVSMRWSDISFQHKVWRIPQTKNDEPVVVPLIEEVIEILKSRMKNGSAYVLPGTSESGHLNDPKKGWKRILEKAEIKNLRLHDLRRTLGSWQAIMGSSNIIIGKSLGHKSQKATEVYARLNIDPVRKSIENATQAMFEASRKN
jgi:integrase